MEKNTKTKKETPEEAPAEAPTDAQNMEKIEDATSSNTILLTIIMVLLIIIILVGAGLGGWYLWQQHKKRLAKPAEPPIQTQIPAATTPAAETLPTEQTNVNLQANLNSNSAAVTGNGTFKSPSTTTRPIVSPDFQMSGVYYWNCKHHYTLTYPAAWANNGATSASNPLILKGNQVQLWVQAFPIAGSETLNDFVKERSVKISGQLAWVESLDWDGTALTQVTYRGPDSLAMWWLTTSYGMEIKAFGPGYAKEYENIANTLSTLDPNRNVYQCASNPNQTFGKAATATQPVQPTAPATPSCTYPDGDPVDWWCMVSEAQRDCYENKHGDPDDISDKDCVKTTNEDDEDCNYPKGPVEDWWDDASKSAKNCYLDDGGDPPED
jgi:hypothetical protein